MSDGPAAPAPEITPWGPPPARPRAERGVVDVWLLPLDVDDGARDGLARHLDADERARAARLIIERVRLRWTAARGWLRRTLALYLGFSPEALAFAEGPQGKPALAGGPAASPLRFNLSHSAGRALLAITAGTEVGVDIEEERDTLDHAALAHRWFTPVECAGIAAHATPAARQSAFFRGWSGKEAFIKACGESVAGSLARFDLDLAPGAPLALVATRPDATERERMTLLALPAPAGFAAALAVVGRVGGVRCFEVRM